MKNKKIALFLVVTMVVGLLVGGSKPLVMARQEKATVNFDVDMSSKQLISKAKKVGVNLEMSMISDEMWQTNGHWMEETFVGGKVPIMRWGYDAWVFDWENEVPLLPDKYWGGNNSKDAKGSFGLYEFVDYCQRNDVIPFVDIPIESHDHNNPNSGVVTLDKVKQLTHNMAVYLNQQGIEEAYFDMGNEPWSGKSNKFGGIPAVYYGQLFQDFQAIIKAVNPNYKLVLQHAPKNILWTNWNQQAETAAAGYFDAYDDHQYYFTYWDKFYDKNDDNFFETGKVIDGVEALMGECNVAWTKKIWPNEWDDGHARDLGSGLALLNAFLDIVNKDSYQQIITWPSHYPGKGAVEGGTNHPFGWFNLDQWEINRQTERINGPIIAHTIVNQHVLDYKVNIASDNPKVRCFGYTNADNSVLKVILVNKLWHDELKFNFNLGDDFDGVNAMVMKGDRTVATPVIDKNPVYQSHMSNEQITSRSFSDMIPYGESAIVYTFYKEDNSEQPQSFELLSPMNDATEVSTMKCFQWEKALMATDYHLQVSENADLSSPIIDTRTGGQLSYQSMGNLEEGTTYYWTVWAENKNGQTQATNQVMSFKTFEDNTIVLNDSSSVISYSGNWNAQTSIGCYQNDDHAGSGAGDFLEVSFSGQQIKLYGIKGPWCGKFDVFIDNQLVSEVDAYDSVISTQQELFSASDLTEGEHTLKAVIRGDKNSASRGTWFEFDKLELE